MDNNIQNNAPNNPDNNRPRLRKIKRPKQHNGPIAGMPNPNSVNRPDGRPNPSQQNTGSKPIERPATIHPKAGNVAINRNNPPAGLSSADIIKSARQQPNTNLVSAADREVYNQSYNNFSAPNFNDDFTENDTFTYQGNTNISNMMFDNKKVLIIACVCVLIGLILGNFMFSSEAVVRDGLQGVVVNPEVPKGRTRCGVAEKTQGCVLYIMNPQRNELNGRDFYDLAAQLTGRQRFVIETGNMRYSTIKVKPGNIAQLNIPPLQ